MALSPNIFRAYDIRGEYGKELDEEGMEAIGLALGTMMRDELQETCVIGRDVRSSSKSLSDALKKGLIAAGVQVFDSGETSFGISVFTTQKSGKEVCAYVTASHLPPKYNGLKIFYGTGLSFSADEIEKVGLIATGKKYKKREGGADGGEMNYRKDYIEFMVNHFDCKGVKVALDCGGGATCHVAPQLFEAMGFETTKIFCDVDPTFSKRDSKPSEESLGELMKKVPGVGADFGVGFDGDGDRAVIVDEKGNVISADQFAIVVGKRLLAKEKGAVIATVECSMLAEDVLEPLGANVIRVPVGHTFMMQAGKDHNAVLGYEDSGHMVMPRLSLFDDAMYIVMELAAILKQEKKPLSQLVNEFPVYPRTRVTVECSDDKKFDVVDRLKEKYSREYSDVNTMDGVRVQFSDGWVLVRCSNTGAKIRATIEANYQERVEELAKKFGDDLKKEASQ